MRSIDPPRPFGNRVYLEPQGLRVPMREIPLTAPEPPVRLYDTSGPYGDPDYEVDLDGGLPRMRGDWISARGDVESGSAPAVRARPGSCVTQMHYARRGEITPEMEYIAIRENQRLEELDEALAWQHPGDDFGANIPKRITPEFVRDEVARGRAIIPNNINHPESEPMIDRPQLPREDQCEHRQLGGHLLDRGRGREDGLVHPLGWRHRHGSLDGQANIHETREWILRNSPVPIGTVPIYQALEKVDGIARRADLGDLPRGR